MKKLISISLLSIFGLWVIGSAPSVSHAGTVLSTNVSASIPMNLSLTVTVKELIGGTPAGPDLSTTMNFGDLIKDGLNAQWGSRSFAVFVNASTTSTPYTINATMPAPTSGANTLPNATLLHILSAKKDGSDIVGDAFNAAPQAAVMSNSVLYTSSPSGDSALLEINYGISGGNADGSIPFPGWEGIPPDFPSGQYSTTVSYSLVLI